MAVGLALFACTFLLIMVLIINKCGQHSKFGLHRKFSFFKMTLMLSETFFCGGEGVSKDAYVLHGDCEWSHGSINAP